MNLSEFVKDLTMEMEDPENKGWAEKKVVFGTIDGDDLEYLSVYDAGNKICIDIGTSEDSDEHNKHMLE